MSSSFSVRSICTSSHPFSCPRYPISPSFLFLFFVGTRHLSWRVSCIEGVYVALRHDSFIAQTFEHTNFFPSRVPVSSFLSPVGGLQRIWWKMWSFFSTFSTRLSGTPHWVLEHNVRLDLTCMKWSCLPVIPPNMLNFCVPRQHFFNYGNVKRYHLR